VWGQHFHFPHSDGTRINVRPSKSTTSLPRFPQNRTAKPCSVLLL